MLVLRRFVDEMILVGDNILIKVCDTGRSQDGRGWAKIGIEAPIEISVNRSEIQDRIDRGEQR